MELGMGKKARYYLIAKYKPDENNDKKLKILDEDFIKKNKDKAKIIYKNKIYELKEYFEDIDENYNHKDLIKLKIILPLNHCLLFIVSTYCVLALLTSSIRLY